MVHIRMTMAALDAVAKELRIAATGGGAFLATSGAFGSGRTAVLAGAIVWAVFQSLALLVSSISLDQ